MKRFMTLAVLLTASALVWAQGQDAPPPDQPAGQGQWGRGGPHGPGIAGTITAINGNTITVKTMDGATTQINVTDKTRYRKERQQAALTDLKVGDNIFVRGEKSSDGIVQAQAVAVPPQGMQQNFREGMGKRFIMGQIKSINGTQIEIARPDGVTQTIAVDENTSFKKDNESITLADLKPGDRIFGRGEMKNDVFVAAVLNSGRPPMRRGGNWRDRQGQQEQQQPPQ